MSADEQDLVDANYGPSYQKLKEVKAAYDPDNLFRLNANVVPTV
jgi:FAD/FMN-containing dehydrogenase